MPIYELRWIKISLSPFVFLGGKMNKCVCRVIDKKIFEDNKPHCCALVCDPVQPCDVPENNQAMRIGTERWKRFWARRRIK